MPQIDIHSFRADLKRFDPKLDIEWVSGFGCYEVFGIDRRGVRYPIFRFGIGEIDRVAPFVLDALYKATPHRQGGADVVNARIDADIEREEAAAEKRLKDDLDYLSAEAWDIGSRVYAKDRISNIGIPEPPGDNQAPKESDAIHGDSHPAPGGDQPPVP